MKEILVPTDFSAAAENAVNFAVQSAKLAKTNLLLLHAFELNGDVYTDYMGVNRAFNQSQFQEVKENLAQVARQIENKESIIADTTVFKGSVREGILQLEKEKNIDLVIMGTAGANGLLHKIWGSKTSAIIEKTTVPLLAIPVEYKWKKPAKILLATNHFETDQKILGIIFELAECYKATVELVVFTNEEQDTAFTYLEHDRNIPAYEAWLDEKYSFDYIQVTHLFGNDFEQALENFISQNNIDLLAMVTYKKSFADRLFHPSITKRISYHTKIPLLAIPAKEE